MDEQHEPNGLVRRAIRGWWSASKINWDTIPKPSDEPRARVEGPDTDRVLFIGDGPALGFGVASHQLAIPGQLARQVAALTHRGVDLQLVTSPGLSSSNALAAYTSERTGRYDAAVTLLGPTDAVRLTPVVEYRANLEALLQAMVAGGIPRALVLGIPSFAAMPIVAAIPARLAQAHAPLLDAQLRQISESWPGVRYLPFAPPVEPEPDRYRSASTYRAWASLIAPDLAGMLNELARERRAFTPPRAAQRVAGVDVGE